ncbi:MAG TPA: Tad domain-containing protein [Anaerolineales bacterium]|nr:Tad domain-containing protein [Anaerolineales bacterium]
MKSTRAREKGQALIVIALAAVAIFGFVGLAVDGTAKFSDRRHAQNAADTAALAAALVKVNQLTDAESNPSISTTPAECPPTSPLTMSDASDVCVELMLAGLDRADDNGYDSANSTVVIYSPPISGYYATVANNDEYVQVIITSRVQTTFMRIFGVTQSENIVSAVAYAKQGGELANGAMIIAYDPDPNCPTGTGPGNGSVDVSGGATVNLYGGGIFVNSQDTCGFRQPNCTAAALNIYGGAGISTANAGDNIEQCASGTVNENYGEPAVAIPDGVYFPDEPPQCSPSMPGTAYNTPPGSDTWHITPGYYTDFPQQSINGNLFGKKQYIIMDPGVYCTDNDIQWNGQTFLSLDGSSGVTLYIKSGSKFSLNIDSPITLYASNSGDYQGYLIIQEGTHTDIQNCVINGGSYLDIEGLIWAPYCEITLNGGNDSQAPINAQLVGWQIKIDGNNTINFNYNPDNQVRIKRKLGLMK